MARKPTAHIARHLVETDVLVRLTDHARRIARLQRVFVQGVPAGLAGSSRVVNVSQGVVVVGADNGAAANRLRQLSPRLGTLFRTAGIEVTEVRIKLQPTASIMDPQAGAKPGRSLSADVGAVLSKTARALPAGELKDALEHLVRAAVVRQT